MQDFRYKLSEKILVYMITNICLAKISGRSVSLLLSSITIKYQQYNIQLDGHCMKFITNFHQSHTAEESGHFR